MANMRIITVNLPEDYLADMDKLRDLYPSHSELIRVAVHDFIAEYLEKGILPQLEIAKVFLRNKEIKIARAKELLQQPYSKRQIRRMLKQEFGKGFCAQTLIDLEDELRQEKNKEKKLDLASPQEQGYVHEKQIEQKEVMKTV